MSNFSWIFKMAIKDAIQSKNRLIIYISSIVLGIASLVAIQSFRESVKAKINADAKELLGADMLIKSNRPFTPEISKLIDKLGGKPASEKSFATMVSNPHSDISKLINARALQGNYPFYGVIETEPQLPSSALSTGNYTFVDETVMLQMNLNVGDSIKLGKVYFSIIAIVKKAPGQAGIAASVAPPVYISQKGLDQTGLETFGSRIRYRHYLQFENGLPSKEFLQPIEDQLFTDNVRIETVAQRKEQLGEAFNYLNNFLNLVGFIALMLGCIGVASSVILYMKEKQNMIATLRCLGTSSATIFKIFFLEIMVLGFIGSLIGAILGSSLQSLLPVLLKDLLVVDVDFVFSPTALFTGIAIGVLSSLLFTLESLLLIRHVPPLLAINSSAQSTLDLRSKILSRSLIALFVFAFSYLQTYNLIAAVGFTAATALVFGLLALLSIGFQWIVKKKLPSSFPYVVRQGLANTARPNNQSTELTVSIGLGAMLMSLLILLQSNLVSQLTLADKNEQPNLILFDVQTDQQNKVEDLFASHQMPLIQKVPIVAMRLEKIKDRTRLELKNDSLLKMPSHILSREYRVTYRDSLSDSEELIEGEFIPDAAQLNYIPISLEKRQAEQMEVKVGDALVFNVQGVLLDVVVGSIRKVHWNKMQTNFTIVFPNGVLESAPQTFAYVSRADTKNVSASFQRTAVKEIPNVSVIDLNTVLETVNEVVEKIALVIRFMALICILTGFIVLIGTISNSKYQRLKETVLLRTIGASKSQIVKITLTEYLTLGMLSALSGIVLGVIGAFLLTKFVFEFNFQLDVFPISIILISITAVVTLLGYTNNREIVKSSPLDVLRRE